MQQHQLRKAGCAVLRQGARPLATSLATRRLRAAVAVAGLDVSKGSLAGTNTAAHTHDDWTMFGAPSRTGEYQQLSVNTHAHAHKAGVSQRGVRFSAWTNVGLDKVVRFF
jgi:hypothetical protein